MPNSRLFSAASWTDGVWRISYQRRGVSHVQKSDTTSSDRFANIEARHCTMCSLKHLVSSCGTYRVAACG